MSRVLDSFTLQKDGKDFCRLRGGKEAVQVGRCVHWGRYRITVNWEKVKGKVNQILMAFDARMWGWQSIRWATKPVCFGEEE